MTEPYEDDAAPGPYGANPAPPVVVSPMTLYRVDGRGRVNLAGVVADGIEFYTATRNAIDGSITLHPVQVATTSVKRSAIEDVPIPGI